MFCSNCGAELKEGSRFCTDCGTENLQQTTQNNFHVDNEVQDSTESTHDTLQVEYISFFTRLFAYILDMFFLFAIAFLIGIALGLMGFLSDAVANWLGFIIGLLYFTLQESSAKQATFGKRIMKIKVVDEHFQRISYARALGRYFSKILSGILLAIGYIMIFFTKKHQGLHDKIASTFVIRA